MGPSPSYQYRMALNVDCNITYFAVPFAVLQMMVHLFNKTTYLYMLIHFFLQNLENKTAKFARINCHIVQLDCR